MYKIFLTLCIGASLLACSSHLEVYSNRIAIGNSLDSNKATDSIIQPYRDTLMESMSIFVAQANEDLIVQRPSSNLMNWVANAIYANQTSSVRLSIPAFCLLNTGGIRSSLSKGDVTVGDFFKLMPFDNQIVWIEMPIESLKDVESYLIQSSGEPLGNASFDGKKLTINPSNSTAKSFIIITSDYLVNGGDKMDFFKKGKVINISGKLLRDALIEEARMQKTLTNY